MRNESVAGLIGTQVRRRREQRGMSASELARRAGLSKATLSGIESGRANPTIDTLHAVAIALAIPLADLIAADSPDGTTFVPAAPHDDDISRTMLRREAGGRAVEIWRLTLAPRASFDGVPHATGTRESLLVARGSLVAGPADEPVEIAAGDFVSFAGDAMHAYAAGPDGAEVAVVITSPGA